MGNAGLPELLVVGVIGLLYAAVVVVPATMVCRKAGFSPWLGLLAIVPFANILLLWYLAVARWPNQPERGLAPGGWTDLSRDRVE